MRIEKFNERRKLSKDLLVDPLHDGISAETNLRVYDAFASKAETPLYRKRPSCQTDLIESGREKFISLSLEEQCSLISNLLLYFGMGGGKADLSLLGGSKNAGVLVHGSSFRPGKKKLVIFDSSVTGLFERREEIMI